MHRVFRVSVGALNNRVCARVPRIWGSVAELSGVGSFEGVALLVAVRRNRLLVGELHFVFFVCRATVVDRSTTGYFLRGNFTDEKLVRRCDWLVEAVYDLMMDRGLVSNVGSVGDARSSVAAWHSAFLRLDEPGGEVLAALIDIGIDYPVRVVVVEMLVLIHHHRLLMLVLSHFKFVKPFVKLDLAHLVVDATSTILRRSIVAGSSSGLGCAWLGLVGLGSTKQVVWLLHAPLACFPGGNQSRLVKAFLGISWGFQISDFILAISNTVFFVHYFFCLKPANWRLIGRCFGYLGFNDSVAMGLGVVQARIAELWVK